MTDESKNYVFDGYIQENIWNKLIKMLKSLTKRSRRKNSENTPDTVTPVTPITEKNDNGKRVPKKFKTGIDFELNENLIYYFGNGKRRLYLFSLMEKNAFHLTHDENIHTSVHRCFNQLIKNIYSPLFQEISALHRTLF